MDSRVHMDMTSASRRVAVLSKKKLATHRYDEWLAPAGIETELFAEDAPGTVEILRGTHRFADVHLFPNWKLNRAVDQAVIESHNERPFSRIIALSECDIVRAAELRERLGLRGQRTASALAFRDKWVMKKLVSNAGLDVPAFRRPDSAWNLLDFANRHHWSIAVKPIDGAGALGVTLLRDRDSVESWLEHSDLNWDQPSGFLAEELIDAPMLVIDGLMRASTPEVAVVSAYTATCLDTVASLAPMGVLMLDRADPRVPAAMDYLEHVLKALPGTAETLSFHCELFDTADRGMLLCEIACRTGGASQRTVVYRARGVDLERAACLGQAGADDEVRRPGTGPGRMFGSFLMPRSNLTLPRGARCDVPGVAEMTIHFERMAADQPKRPAKVSDTFVDAVLEGENHSALCRTCDDVVAWYLGYQDQTWT